MADPALAPRSAFAGLLPAQAPGAGITVADRDGIGLATVLARKGRTTALATRLNERFGLALPEGPTRAAAGAIAFAGIGPGAWLATSEADGNGFAAALRQAIGEFAAVVDQSDGYAVLRLDGPRLRAVLAKGVPLDLHERVFRPGDVATTLVSHMGATLWRLPDASDGSPSFEIAIHRSMARSFWHWLSESAAEFGLAGMTAGDPAGPAG